MDGTPVGGTTVRPSTTAFVAPDPVFLALKEMRRAAVRFGLLMASIGLLVFLILFQQTLQTGLITSFVGAIRNQSAPVLVYSVDGRRNLQGSVITPDLQRRSSRCPASGLRRTRPGHVQCHRRGQAHQRVGHRLPARGAGGADHAGQRPPPHVPTVRRWPWPPRPATASGSATRSSCCREGSSSSSSGRRPRSATRRPRPSSPPIPRSSRRSGPATPTPGPSPGGHRAVARARGHRRRAGRPVNDAVAGADAVTRPEAVASTPGVAQVQQSFRSSSCSSAWSSRW